MRHHCSIAAIALAVTMAMAPVLSFAAQTDAIPTINGPLTLTDAVQTALRNNPMVGAAAYRTEAALARVGMAKAQTLPQIGVFGFAGKSQMGDIITSPPGVMPSGAFAIPGETGVTGSAGLMVPIFTGGRLSGSLRSAQASAKASASDQASVKLNTALATKAAYHKALLAQSTVGVYQDLVAQAQERERIAALAFKEGKIAKYDLLRNQSELADAQQQLNNAQRDAQMAMIELKTVLGVSQASDITLSDQLAYEPLKDNLDTYTALAIKSRPELAAARARVESAGSDVRATKGLYAPQVYGTAMEGVSAVSGNTQSGLTIGVSMGITLVDGGERRAAVKEAQAMLAAMKQDERQSLLGVQQDVATAWTEAQTAEKNVELSNAAVVQAEEDYRVIRLRYEAGKAVNVEVLDALTSLVRAQNNRLMALYEHNIAKDNLSRAIGEDG